MTFGRRIVLISSLVILLWMICVGVFVYRSSLPFASQNKLLSPKSAELELEYCKSKGEKLNPGFWQRINLHSKKIPPSIKESVPVINVESSSITVQGHTVHYIYAKPKNLSSDIPVLLLHGQSYTSETWNDLGTLKILAALGFYSFAVDLPGFGKTPSVAVVNKSDFIDNLISVLNIKKPVLISPSMSGAFSLVYLIKHPEKLGGFIPVSPVRTTILSGSSCKEDNTELFFNDDCQKIIHYLKSDNLKLNCIKVPSLIVWGEMDRGENSAKLCLLPESQGAEIPKGKHSAYLSDPELWHDLLYNFLSILNETQACR